jgi:hypothetical protein
MQKAKIVFTKMAFTKMLLTGGKKNGFYSIG